MTALPAERGPRRAASTPSTARPSTGFGITPGSARAGTGRAGSSRAAAARPGSGRRIEPTRVALRRPAAVIGPAAARRAPFVAVVLFLVGAGLVALLVLNTAIAADSFAQRSLSQQIERLTLQEQQLQQEVSAAQAPAALARAAAEHGMVPGGTPGFLVVNPDGTTQVVGQPKPAARPAPAPAPPPRP